MSFTAALVPLTNTPASSAEDKTYQARTRLLGEGWDQPGVVRLKWITNTTWIMSFGGLVTMADSTVMRYVGGPYDWPTKDTSLDEVLAAKPEYIFQNHTHYDQMHQSTDLTIKAGSKLIGGTPHCEVTKRNAYLRGLDPDKVDCILVKDAQGKPFNRLDSYFTYGQEMADVPGLGLTPFGTFGELEEVPPGLEVKALLIKHTQARLNYVDEYNSCFECYDLRESHVDPTIEGYTTNPEKPENLAYEGVYKFPPGAEEGGNIAYFIRYGDFTMVLHGGSGSLNPAEPAEKEIRKGLQAFSGMDDKIDVELGTIVETQAFAQGLIDARRYAEQIKAKVFFPMHHNNWGSLSAGEAVRAYQPFMDEMVKIPENIRPDVCFTVEENMHTAWSFETSEWVGANKGTVTPIDGPNCFTG